MKTEEEVRKENYYHTREPDVTYFYRYIIEEGKGEDNIKEGGEGAISIQQIEIGIPLPEVYWHHPSCIDPATSDRGVWP